MVQKQGGFNQSTSKSNQRNVIAVNLIIKVQKQGGFNQSTSKSNQRNVIAVNLIIKNKG